MTDNAELDGLIVENLLDLDAAAKRIEVIGENIWESIIEHLDDWAKKQGWKGAFERDNPWTAPQEWFLEGQPEAWFYPDKGPDDTGEGIGQEPYFWLSRYLGVAGGQLCLWFGQDSTGTRKWKPLAKDHARVLAETDFHLSDSGNFYTVCNLDSKAVAAAIADGRLEEAMTPLLEALERADKAKTLFSTLLAKARKA
ncbi:hypothetical protein [Mesorhizobium sp. M0244]|uniref:hypothetical protein n=1 Tax=unclassified Mesorhizobium TaxID=325217 RepID=UPI0033394372